MSRQFESAFKDQEFLFMKIPQETIITIKTLTNMLLEKWKSEIYESIAKFNKQEAEELQKLNKESAGKTDKVMEQYKKLY